MKNILRWTTKFENYRSTFTPYPNYENVPNVPLLPKQTIFAWNWVKSNHWQKWWVNEKLVGSAWVIDVYFIDTSKYSVAQISIRFQIFISLCRILLTPFSISSILPNLYYVMRIIHTARKTFYCLHLWSIRYLIPVMVVNILYYIRQKKALVPTKYRIHPFFPRHVA